jgi:hypothetical protein
VERHLQDFRQVESMAAGELGDLLAATKSVSDDQPVGRSLPDCREEFQFANSGGDFVLVVLEAEGSGHAAASGSRRLKVYAKTAKE